MCLKRIIIAYTTATMQTPISLAILIYTKTSIFTIGYTITQYPMATKGLNNIEIINEFFILVSGYYVILFS